MDGTTAFEDSGSPSSQEHQKQGRRQQEEQEQEQQDVVLVEDEEDEEDPRMAKSPSFATPESGSQSSEHESSPMSKPNYERFLRLQAYLKLRDEADPKEHLNALRTLSAAARSGHARVLEARALFLSLQEHSEMNRLMELNVLRRHKKSSSPGGSVEPGGDTPVGVRLPAPGADTEFGQGQLS